MNNKVWILFTQIGNPQMYTLHGVFNNEEELNEARAKVSDKGNIYIVARELNRLKSVRI